MVTYNKLYFQYNKLYLNYLKKIIKILNNYHGKNYNQNYWEPIIGLYLRRFILNYLMIKKISKKKDLVRPLNYNRIVFFRNYRDYANYGDFLELSKKNFYLIKKYENNQKFETNHLSTFSIIINHIKIFGFNILIKLKITKIAFFESYFKKSLKYLFILRSLFYFYKLPNLNLENYSINKKKIFLNRLSLLKKNYIKSKEDFLLNNIILFMPINYIENYKTIFTEVEKINLSEAIYIDGNEVNYDFIKFYIANLRLKKKKILIGQHSLRSGLDDYDVFYDYSESICNFFLSWGWRDKLNFIKKFSSLRIFSSLNKFKKIEKIRNQSLNVCFILCSYSIIGECLYDNYLENEKSERARINLLSKIQKKNKIKISLKPRSGSFILKNKSKFYNQFESLKYKSRMYEVFGKYNIVIFERVSLGLVECIYLNQPTVLYYPKNLYKHQSKRYQEFINLLRKANMLIDNSQKFIELTNSSEKIFEWWFDKKNLLRRNEILEAYAKSFSFSDLKKFKNLLN